MLWQEDQGAGSSNVVGRRRDPEGPGKNTDARYKVSVRITDSQVALKKGRLLLAVVTADG